jgi:hypothetical protein
MEKEEITKGKYWWSATAGGFSGFGQFDTIEECIEDIEDSSDEWEDYYADQETDLIPIGIATSVYNVGDLIDVIKDRIADEALSFSCDSEASFSKDFDEKLKDLLINEVDFGAQAAIQEVGCYNVKTHEFIKGEE